MVSNNWTISVTSNSIHSQRYHYSKEVMLIIKIISILIKNKNFELTDL